MLDERNTRPCTVELLASAATELRIMALIDDGGAKGCYGPSLVPVLPQAPGGAQHPPPAPPTLRPCLRGMSDAKIFGLAKAKFS